MRIFFALMLIFLPSLALAQTKPSDEEQQRLAEMARIQAEAASLPQVKADSIQQIVKFSIEQNMLTARTPLTSVDGPAHVIIPELHGVVRLTLFAHQDTASLGRNFQLMEQDLTNPKAGDVYTMIAAVAGGLNLSRESEPHEMLFSVQLIEDAPPMRGGAAEDEPVRLLIRRNDPDDKSKELNLTLGGQNFWDLIRRHSREVDLYLRPIIRDYHQEAEVFAIPPAIAWQVLGGHYTPDAAMAQQIDALVKQLDADDFRQREKAMQQLQQIGEPAALTLNKIDRQKLSPQQSAAIDSFLAAYVKLAPKQMNDLADDPSFLLDVLYNNDAALRQLALDRLSQIEKRKIELRDTADVARLRQELMPATQP